MTYNRKPAALALGALAGGLLLSGAAFSATPLAQGYLLGAHDAAAHGDKTAADAPKAAHGACGAAKGHEGSCGMAMMDGDKDGRLSKAEFAAAHGDDDSRFGTHDTDGDGFISAAEMAAHKAAMPKKDSKAGMEGKCGEGKCGGAD